MVLDEIKTIKLITSVILLTIVMFFGGYFIGSSAYDNRFREYPEPVTAAVNGVEMPVISTEIIDDCVLITTDDNNTILVNGSSVIIYENKKYYEK